MNHYRHMVLTTTLGLSLWLNGCTLIAPPHQAMSDAKQALASANAQLIDPVSAQDSADYLLAKGLIADGETALNLKEYSKANNLFRTSQKHARAILQRYQQPVHAQPIILPSN